jgi:hypothetical protein
VSVVPEILRHSTVAGGTMTESLFGDDSPDCPQCGAATALPILYGSPSEEMIMAAKLNQIVLGGEDASDSHRAWRCQSPQCSYRF